MGLPTDHAALLRQQDFVIPGNNGLDERERLLLLRYGRWMEALSAGIIQALTPEQEQFVRVARGRQEPHTDFERAWVKIAQLHGQSATPEGQHSAWEGSSEVSNRIEQLAEAKRYAREIHAAYQQRRESVLEQVRAQLEALEKEFGEMLREADEEVGRLEIEVKEAVRHVGQSVKQEGIHAIYMRGRVMWENRGLSHYAETHPEVLEFRRIGNPSVSIRYKPSGVESYGARATETDSPCE
jgi:uncharacterized protein YifE (UPF0438 family)